MAGFVRGFRQCAHFDAGGATTIFLASDNIRRAIYFIDRADAVLLCVQLQRRNYLAQSLAAFGAFSPILHQRLFFVYGSWIAIPSQPKSSAGSHAPSFIRLPRNRPLDTTIGLLYIDH